MENTSRIYDALVTLLGQSKQWADVRHLYTLVWMVIGLIHSGSVKIATYKDLLKRVSRLMPKRVKVVLLGERGFIDTQLMKYVRQQLGWS